MSYTPSTNAVLLRPNRKGTYLSLAFAAVATVIGVAMVAEGTTTGIALVVLAAIGFYAGAGGLVPGQGLRLDGQGFYLKSFGKSFGAQWLEIEGFEAKRLRIGRRGDVDVVEIRYQPGLGDARVPKHWLGKLLGIDERYLIAAYGDLSNKELAELLERYRTSRF
jgi:hypothetical protein